MCTRISEILIFTVLATVMMNRTTAVVVYIDKPAGTIIKETIQHYPASTYDTCLQIRNTYVCFTPKIS